MTRNILPKSDEMKTLTLTYQTNSQFNVSNKKLSNQLKQQQQQQHQLTLKRANFSNTNNSANTASHNRINTNSMSSSDEDNETRRAQPHLTIIQTQCLPLILNRQLDTMPFAEMPFERVRLNQWYSNEEIFNILTKCHNYLISSSNCKSLLLSDECVQRPRNGSIFLFDRRKVKNFKKDLFCWKRRKTGGANSVREDRMCLKVNGIDSIYGCYSHSSLMSTFHRRCYWLLDKPDLVLVHYLQTPHNETGDCFIVLNGNCSSADSNATSNQQQQDMTPNDLKSELKAMLWPFYLDKSFIVDNLKAAVTSSPISLNMNELSSQQAGEKFIDSIVNHLLFKNQPNISQVTQTPSQSFRINFMSFMNLSTSAILTRISNLKKESSSLLSSSPLNKPIDMQSHLSLTNNINTDLTSSLNVQQDNHVDCQTQLSKANRKRVQLSRYSLSLTHHTLHPDEKFMIIGDDWSTECAYALKIDNKHELKLIRSNKHVLECQMAGFVAQIHALTRSDTEQAHTNISLYLYENRHLYGEPIAFELVKHTANTLASQNKCENRSDKNELFILERILVLLREYDALNATVFAQFHLDTHSSFEKRSCGLIDALTAHLASNQTRNAEKVCEMENANGGKTLLHLSVECGFANLIECLLGLKRCIKTQSQAKSHKLLRDELNIFKLDEQGHTALMLAARFNYHSIAHRLANYKQIEFDEVLNEVDSNQIASYVLQAVDQANKHGHMCLARQLNELLVVGEEEQSDENMLNSTNDLLDDLNLIENLDDFSSLLNPTGTESPSVSQSELQGTRDDEDDVDGHEEETEKSVHLSSVDYQQMFSSFDENSIVNLFDDTSHTHQLHLMMSSSSSLLPPFQSEHQHQRERKERLMRKREKDEELANEDFEDDRQSCLDEPDQEEEDDEEEEEDDEEDHDDEHDKKIKALADNIIAAMPHKIKNKSYSLSSCSSSNSLLLLNAQHQSQFNPDRTTTTNDWLFKPINALLRRNAASFDESYDSAVHSRSSFCSTYQPAHAHVNVCSSSQAHANGHLVCGAVDDDSSSRSPIDLAYNTCSIDESTCSSTFHIDSPPSTAEFCQYFHASTSSGYYKHAIETGFAQLTLTDDEQRELYEAALVIQNAYRRYIQRKKKKIRLDLDVERNGATNTTSQMISNNESLILSSGATSAHQISSHSTLQPSQGSNAVLHLTATLSSTQMSSSQSDNLLSGEHTSSNLLNSNEKKQYRAACIIQKYYRRYKQYENLHKYTEAAVKIQTRYRAYKKSYNHHSQFGSIDETSSTMMSSHVNTSTSNSTKVKNTRKLTSRQSARFSPAMISSTNASICSNPATTFNSSSSNLNNANVANTGQQYPMMSLTNSIQNQSSSFDNSTTQSAPQQQMNDALNPMFPQYQFTYNSTNNNTGMSNQDDGFNSFLNEHQPHQQQQQLAMISNPFKTQTPTSVVSSGAYVNFFNEESSGLFNSDSLIDDGLISSTNFSLNSFNNVNHSLLNNTSLACNNNSSLSSGDKQM